MEVLLRSQGNRVEGQEEVESSDRRKHGESVAQSSGESHMPVCGRLKRLFQSHREPIGDLKVSGDVATHTPVDVTGTHGS